MDAVEYLKTMKRMCDGIHLEDCTRCPLFESQKTKHLGCASYREEYPEEVVEIVEKWSKEHPVKTNKDKFKEVFGREIQSGECEGLVCCGVHCGNCPNKDFWDQDFWNQEYKEPERSESE